MRVGVAIIFLVALTHYGYPFIAMLYDKPDAAARAWFYALRGLQDTLEARESKGLLIVPKDIEQPSSARPVKPRKPKAERTKLPIGRKLVSRNTFKREEVK